MSIGAYHSFTIRDGLSAAYVTLNPCGKQLVQVRLSRKGRNGERVADGSLGQLKLLGDPLSHKLFHGWHKTTFTRDFPKVDSYPRRISWGQRVGEDAARWGV